MTLPKPPLQPDSNALISVALCTWNGAAHLEAQLNSILNQRDVQLELVILDDASSDNTMSLLEARAALDSRIRLFRNDSNLGHLRSFEKCMGMAQGDFIAPADQDDIWEPDKLAKLLAAIDSADLAYCDSEYMSAEGKLSGHAVSDDFEMFSGSNPIPLFFQNTISGHACLFRKELLQAAGPAPEGFFHDWWLALCASGRNGVTYLDERLVHFRRHGGSCTTIGRGTCDLKAPRRNSKWISERLDVCAAYSKTSLREADFAQRFANAIREAVNGRSAAMWQLAWANRKLLPPKSKPGWIKAIELWSRIRRKSKRASKEVNGA